MEDPIENATQGDDVPDRYVSPSEATGGVGWFGDLLQRDQDRLLAAILGNQAIEIAQRAEVISLLRGVEKSAGDTGSGGGGGGDSGGGDTTVIEQGGSSSPLTDADISRIIDLLRQQVEGETDTTSLPIGLTGRAVQEIQSGRQGEAVFDVSGGEFLATIEANEAISKNDQVVISGFGNSASVVPADQAPSDLDQSLASIGNDEQRTRLLGTDEDGNLAEVSVEELGSGVGASEPALVTYLTQALASVGNDEIRTTGAERDQLTDTATDVELHDGAGGGTETVVQFQPTSEMDDVTVSVSGAEGSYHVEVAYQDGDGNDVVVRDDSNNSNYEGDSNTDVSIEADLSGPQVEVRLVDDSNASNTVNYSYRVN